MSREVIDDWEQREFVSSIEDALLKIVDFLNRFDKSCRFKLASVNARLSGLERKLDYVQHCLSQADPQKRNGTLYSIKGTMFDMKHQLDDVRRRLEERNRQMRTQLPMLMEENANLKGVVSLQQAREEAANIRRQATKAMLNDLPADPKPATPPPSQPAKAQTQPPVQNKAPQPVPVQQPPAQQMPPSGPPAGPGAPPSAKPPASSPGPPRGPPGVPSGGPPRGPPGGPPAGPPGAPPRGPPGGPPRSPGGKPPNWGRGENFQVHIMRQGSGPTPTDGQTCIIKYVGKLSGGPRNGETFDESPPNYEFVLGENIVGLEEALKTLKAGCQAKVWIPWSLAYGEEGAGDMIPPKTNLEFDLLLERIL